MIIGKQINELETYGVESKKATINQNSIAKLQYLLTKGLYSDPESAVIVEWTNNGIDSVVQAGKNPIENPVIVKVTNNSFSVQDYGLGLDKNDFETVCMDYLNSTKENTNEAIGAFGIGLKSFLSLNRSATFTCVKDGYKWKFLAYEGAEFLEYDLISEGITDERNGVLCQIQLNDWREASNFLSKAKEKLAYYDSVVLYDGDNIVNNKIIRSEGWQYSSLNKENYIHLCLKDVFYRVDYKKLGINAIDLPIALRFSLSDGLQPTPSRETLIWNTHTIELVTKRIKEVSEWFINKYNETCKEFKDIHHIKEYYSSRYKYLELEGESFEINELEKYSDVKLIKPTYPNIKELELDIVYQRWSDFLCNYKIVAEISYNKFTAQVNKKSPLDKLNQPLYLIDTLPKKQVIDYLKEKHNCCYFVRKINEPRLKGKDFRDDEDYTSILSLNKFPKSSWRTLIQDWQTLENELLNKINPLPEVPKQWIESRKKVRQVSVRNQKLEGEINFKLAKQMEKYSSDWNCKFESTIINLKNFHKNKYLMVYGLDTDRRRLDDLYQLGKRSKSNVKIAIVGERDYKKLETVKLHNLVKMDDFVKEKHKIIAKYVTAYKINTLVNENVETFKSRNFIIKNISANFGNALSELYNYKEDYHNPNNKLIEQLALFCEENNFFDYPIYQTYKEVAKEIHKINFIKLFVNKSRYSYSETIKEEAIPIIRELLVSRKFRMDYTHYQTKAILPTEVLEEETILED